MATLVRSSFNPQKNLLIPCLIFLVLILVIFGVTISMVPYADDFILLTVAAHRTNPLIFFAGDEGLGFSLYRPLHPLSLWIVFKLFGTNAVPNQIINLALHFVNVCLLYRLLRRIRPDTVLAFLLTLLVLVSPYTLSPAIWVSDRPMLWIGLATLLFLNHLFFTDPLARLKPWLLIGMTIFALLNKETGLTLLALTALVALEVGLSSRKGRQLFVASVIVGLSYFGLRYALFGTLTADYYLNGYLFGVFYYENSRFLPLPVKVLAYLNNILWHIVAILLPVFSTENGRIAGLRGLLVRLPLVIATVIPFLAAISRRLTRIQKYALALILLNALVFFGVFSYRDLYVEQIAFCIFVMCADLAQSRIKRGVVLVCIAGLSLYNGFTILRSDLPNEVVLRNTSFENLLVANQARPLPTDILDPQILADIAARYGIPTPTPIATEGEVIQTPIITEGEVID
ncbi:MAG: hypothetical protein ABI700_15635 [Chloroflexota bacterium]